MSVLKTYGSSTDFKPSRTYRLTGDSISGKCDGKEAVMQAIDLALSTERWRYPIYSNDYGTELEHLIGKPRAYIEADIKRCITEALLEDDRISEVKDFSVSFSGDVVKVSCVAVSVFGDISLERSVTYGE